MKDTKQISKLDKLIYDRDIAKCEGCKSINECKQDEKGIQPYIMVKNNKPRLITRICDKVPAKIYGDYEKTIREQDCSILSDKQIEYSKKLYKEQMGFLFGEVGHGKTTIMKCLAKKFSKQRISLTFNLAINITNKVKNFEDGDSTIERLQQTPILFIDDFAREQLTTWTISNVWIPILQYRLDTNKPTYISSNYGLNELYKIISKLRDNVTADMLLDRIKAFMLVVEVKDKNYRL